MYHLQMLKHQALPVSQHGQVHGALSGPLGQHGEVRKNIDAVFVDLLHHIPHLQGVFPFQRAPLQETGDLRGAEPGGCGIQDDQDHKSGEEIHKSAGCQNDDPLPGRLGRKGTGIIAFAVLPFHGAVAADGQQPDGVFGLPLAPVQKPGAHEDGEFVDLDVEQLGRQKMPELMDKDQKAEDENCDDDKHRVAPIEIKCPSYSP